MKNLLFAAALIVVASTSSFTASAKALTAQQQKMSDCSKQGSSQGLKGQAYKDFMTTCLKSAPATAAQDPAPAPVAPAASSPAAMPAAKQTQQQKMTTCNADAKTKSLTGQARKDYMKSCLSSAPAA